jgi:hypothetical protein
MKKTNGIETLGKATYIDVPTFVANSNGIKCLYYMGLELSRRGLDVKLSPRTLNSFFENIPANFTSLPLGNIENITSQDVFICSESVPPKRIKCVRDIGAKIIWWYLAPHSLLERSKVEPIAGEQICCFSSYVLPELENSFYYQPPLDKAWSKALKTHQITKPKDSRKVFGIYTGKGALRKLPLELFNYIYGAEILLFTRQLPKSRSKLFNDLLRCDGLISFDELSQLNLEAATLGIPIFFPSPIFPATTYKNFPISIVHYQNLTHEAFIKNIEIQRGKKAKQLTLMDIQANNASCINQFKALINTSESRSPDYNKTEISELRRFGNMLRRKKLLIPIKHGQSPGSALVEFYISSLCGSYTKHLRITAIARAVDILTLSLASLRIGKYIKGVRKLHMASVKTLKKIYASLG